MHPQPVTNADRTLRQLLVAQAAMIARARNGQADGWMYKSIEALVLAHGRFVDLSLTSPIACQNGRAHECFANAFRLAQDLDGATYVEGFALVDGLSLAFAHAWCIDQTGALLEPTWQPHGIAYLGIPFALPFTRKTIRQRNRYGILDAPELHWPLLRYGVPEHAKEPLPS